MGKDEQKGEAQAAGSEGFAGQAGGQGYGQQQFIGQQPYFTGAQLQYQFQPQGPFMCQPPLGAFAGGAQGMAGQPGQMGQATQGYGQPQFQPQFQPQGQMGQSPYLGQGQPQYAGFQPQGQAQGGFMGQPHYAGFQPQGLFLGQQQFQGQMGQPQGGYAGHDDHDKQHDKNLYGQQNGPDMGQMYGMMQDVIKGDADPGKIMSFLQASGGDFWKGAIVGAAAVLLLTNSAVKDALAGVVGSVFGQEPTDETGAPAEEA
ncbi:hypothetical protein [Humidesulfovibrio sp.]